MRSVKLTASLTEQREIREDIDRDFQFVSLWRIGDERNRPHLNESMPFTHLSSNRMRVLFY